MATISFEQAKKNVEDILRKYPAGDKRTFMLKQVIMSMMKGMEKKQSIAKANNLVLTFDLDQNDKIPLFRVALA